MIDELKKLREITETLIGNGYLRDQAEEWEYAFDAIPDYVYIVDLKYRLKYINNALADRLKVRKDEIINMPCYKVVVSVDLEAPFDMWLNIPQQEVAKDYNLFIKNLNGWFDITRSPVYSKASNLVGFICVLQEVTEKLKALKDLVAREATLSTIFDSAPIGIGLSGKDRVILSTNKSLQDTLGYSGAELIGKNVRLLYPSEEEYIKVGKLKYSMIKETGTCTLETQFITKSGRLVDICLRTSTIVGSDHLVFTVTDLTNCHERERELKKSEQKYRLIAENLSDSIWTLDKDMNFTYVNSLLEDLMGYLPEEWIGHNISEFATTEDFDVMAKAVLDAIDNQEFKSVTFNSKMLHKDGRNIPLEINAKPIFVDGELVGFQGRTRVLKDD